jgi:hypothetical protein
MTAERSRTRGATSGKEIGVKVVPIGVARFDEPDFPGPIPLLELLFAPDGGLRRTVRLLIDEIVDAIPPCEALDEVFPMGVAASGKVAGNSDIEGAADPAREDIDEKLLSHRRAGVPVGTPA